MSKDNNKFDPLNMPGPDPGKPKHTKEEIDKAKENALSKQLSEAKKDNNSLVAHAAEAGVFLSKNNKEIIDKFYHRAKYGHQGAMPMMCKGQSCRFLNMCPLAEAKVELPINKRCPRVVAKKDRRIELALAALSELCFNYSKDFSGATRKVLTGILLTRKA